MALRGKLNRVLTQYVIAFLVCVSIPIVTLGIVFYDNANFILLKELEEHITREMQRLSDTFDDTMSDLYLSAFKASYDNNLAWYNVASNDYRRLNIVRKLNDYVGEYVDYVILSYCEDSLIYTNIGCMTLETLAKSVFTGMNAELHESYLTYIETLRRGRSPEIIPIGVSLTEIDESAYLTYTYPLLKSDPAGAISFVISGSTLKRLAGEVLGRLYGAVLILDNHDRPLFVDEERVTLSDVSLQTVVNMQRRPEISSIRLDDERLSVIGIESRTSRFRYLAVLSLADYMQRVNQTKRNVLASVLSILLVSILVALWVAFRVYRPIGRLRDYAVSFYRGNRDVEDGNELSCISSVLSEALDANENLSRRLVTQLAFVQERVLLKILRGQFTDRAGIDSVLLKNEIHLRGPFYGVAVISIVSRDEERDDMDSLLPVLRGVLDHRLGGYYCVGLDRRDAVLIVNSLHDDSDHELMGRITDICMSAVNREAGMEVDMGIGRFYADYVQLNKSFLEALAALEYGILKGRMNTVYYTDIDFDKNENSGHWYPMEQQAILRQCLKQGNLAVYHEIIDEIMNRTREKSLSLDFLRCLCFDLINDTLKFLNEFHIELNGDYLQELACYKSLDDLRGKLVRVAGEICDYVNDSNSRESDRMSRLRESIITYLYVNYGNCQLSLDVVADEFGLSAKYLSSLFKQLTGDRFVEYLRNLRITRAKELLAGSNCTIAQVSRDVGFANAARFIRSFKAVEGMTPGRFSDIARSGAAGSMNATDLEK